LFEGLWLEKITKNQKKHKFFFGFCIPIAKRTQGKTTSFEARPKSLFKAFFWLCVCFGPLILHSIITKLLFD